MCGKESVSKSPPTRFEVYCKKLGINPNLVMLKITLFMMYGASASLLPFLTIHMQSIGLTVEEIAIIYLALPLTTFLSPPITGFLADKYGHYKLIVISSLVLNGVFHHALVLIPQMETPGKVPVAYVLRHPETGKVEVWWSPCPSRVCPDADELNLVLDNCLDHCPLRNSSAEKPHTLLSGVHQSIAVRPPTFINTGTGCTCDGKTNDKVPNWGMESNNNLHFHLEKKKNTNSSTELKKKTVGRVSAKNKTRVNATAWGGGPNHTNPAFFYLVMHPDLGDPVEHLGIEVEQDENDTVPDFRQHFDRELIVTAGVNFTDLIEQDLRCGGFVVATNLTYNTLKLLAADCMLQVCSFRDGGPEVCPPDYIPSEEHVFWTYFLLRFLGTTMLSASVTVMDPIALAMVQKYGGEFGRERLFSTVGMAIFSPITGILIDYSSRKLGYTDYSAAFYTYSALIGVSAVSVLMMPIGATMPSENIIRDMMKLLRMPHIIMFILFLFILGNCWGFIESYLFLYLKELGASNYLLGITVSVGTLSSIPFLYGAEKITKKIGHVNVIVIAFFSHALRLTGYSFIDNAWWCFPFEAIESLSVHLMWVAAATYCAVVAPGNLLATLIGILGMSHFGLGRGSGSFIGGLLIGSVGTRESFRLMGLAGVIGGVVYGLMHFFWLHKYTESPEDIDTADSGESEKLNPEDPEKQEAAGGGGHTPSQSTERLSLMIRFNHRGSITSLSGNRQNNGLFNEDLPQKTSKNHIQIQFNIECNKNNNNTELLNSVLQSVFNADNILPICSRKTSISDNAISYVDKGAGSRRHSSNELSKTLLKSALEGNHKTSNPQLNLRTSTPQLSKPSSKVTDGRPVTPQQSKRLSTTEETRTRSNSIREEDENDSTSIDKDMEKKTANNVPEITGKSV